MNRFGVFASILATMLLIAPRTALPCGPGVHILESARGLDLLAASHQEWAEARAEPLAASYLALGSISPDFQWAVDEIDFGHDFSLSYHLMEAARDKGPLFRLFALGHLAHVTASDPACEMFLTPTLLASAPIGILDLASEDGPQGESEGLIEVFGDFILGDWDTMVDVMYDLYLEGPDSAARGREVFLWYCSEGAKFLNRVTDCDKAWLTFQELLAQADGILGNMDRESSRDFLRSLFDQSPAELANLFTSGFVQSFIGGRMSQSDNFDREFSRFIASPAMDTDFWAQYDDFLYRLAPEWIVERVRTGISGFPSWSRNAIISGNVQSMMLFVPGSFQVVPGLIVDDVHWQNQTGTTVTSLTGQHEGADLQVTVRFFSPYPFTGTVRGVVKKDRPGSDNAGDPIVGEALLAVDIDPLAYVTTPRSLLTVPFTADTTGAIGLYLELWFEGGSGPWLTTNWDQLWTIPDMDMEQPAIRSHFGTYGHWPPSLPVAVPDVIDSRVFVKARVAPAGGGIPDATVLFGDDGRSYLTGWNGLAVFDQAGDQETTIAVTAPGFATGEPFQVMPVALENTWVETFLHAYPVVSIPAPWSGDASCVRFRVAGEPFQGQVDRFLTRASILDEPERLTDPVETRPDQEGQACFTSALDDGTAVYLQSVARYRNGTLGIEGTAGPIWIDASAPVLDDRAVRALGDPCHYGVPFVVPFMVDLFVTEPHSPIEIVEWKGTGDWTPGAWDSAPGEIPGTMKLSFPPDVNALALEGTLLVRVINAAGLATETTIALPSFLTAEPCPVTPDPGLGQDDVAPRPDAWVPAEDASQDAFMPDAVADVQGDDGKRSSGACSGTTALADETGALPTLFLILALLLTLFTAPRRPPRRQTRG
jgi:hypothetical protein